MQIFQWTLPIHVFIFQFNSRSIIAALKFLSLNNVYACLFRASVSNFAEFNMYQVSEFQPIVIFNIKALNI